MKRILFRRATAFFCCVFLIAQASAAPALASDILFDFNVLGVMDGLDGNMAPEDGVTRAQFAQIVVNMMGYTTVAAAVAGEDIFSDAADNPYRGAINVLYRLDIVSGTAQNTFSPDSFIRVAEACKILVDALGYSVMVKEKTLESYYGIAVKIGVTKGLRANDGFLTFGNACTIVNNALDMDIITREYTGDRAYKIEPGNTFRNSLLSATGSEVVKMSGVVTADITTYIYHPTSSLRETQIEIDGKLFDYKGAAPLGLVGQTVEFYLQTDNNDSYITGMKPTGKNTVASLFSDDVLDASINRITYEKDGRQSFLRVDGLTKYIYNNRIDPQFRAPQIELLKNAVIKVIDNNNDQIADVVIIEEFTDCVVDQIYARESMVYFKNSVLPDGATCIRLDAEDQENYVEIRNSDGKRIDFDQIAQGDVLSVAISRLGDAVLAVVSNKTVVGLIDEYDDETVSIGSEEYRYNISAGEIRLKKEVAARLNFMDKIVHAEYFLKDNNYACVYQIGRLKNSLSPLQVKLLIPGPVAVKYAEQEDEGGGETIKTPKLFCRNSGVAVYPLSDNVRAFDALGKTIAGDELENTISGKAVSYTLNSQGEISRIELLKQAGIEATKRYNANELTFGRTTGDAFGIQQKDTLSVCIPTNADASDDDLRSFVELLNEGIYDVQGFELDEETSLVELITVREALSAGVPGEVSQTSDIGMITKISQVITEDNAQTKIKLTMLTNGGLGEFWVSDLIPAENSFSFLSLRKGDLIAYELDGFDYLNGFEVLQGIDQYYDQGPKPYAFQGNEVFCGIVGSVRRNYVSNARNRWVYSVEARFSNSDLTVAEYDVYSRGSTPVFILESNKNSRLGTLDDIQIGDRIFIGSGVERIMRVIVLYRG